MIIVYQKENAIFHLVRSMGRDGFGVGIKAYCGDKSSNDIQQLPDKYADEICKSCIEARKKIS
tara:strand:- start:15957 stop:16145 length:189 start_codon:yes stop_codon:yes gene_type:complete